MKRIALLTLLAATAASGELIVHDNREFEFPPYPSSCKGEAPGTLYLFQSAAENAAINGDAFTYVPGLLTFCQYDPSGCNSWGDYNVYTANTGELELGVYNANDVYTFRSQCGDVSSVTHAYPLSEFETIGDEGYLRGVAPYLVFAFGGTFEPEVAVFPLF